MWHDLFLARFAPAASPTPTRISGLRATRRLSAVRWGVTREIVLAWLLTFPASGLVAYLAYLLLSRWA